MGTHASAVVFYGYDLGDMEDRDTWESLAPSWLRSDGEDDHDDGSTDPEDRLARLLGWCEAPFPSGVPHRSEYGRGPDANDRYSAAEQVWKATPEYQAWSASLTEKRRVIAEEGPGVEFAWYGYLDGESSHYVAIVESEQRIPEYGSGSLDVIMMSNVITESGSIDWDARLLRYVELMELEPATRGRGPGWHVAVKYG